MKLLLFILAVLNGTHIYMNNKYIKYILSLSILISTTMPSVVEAKQKNDSPYGQKNSKVVNSFENKKQKKNTYNYKTVVKKKSRVPKAKSKVKFQAGLIKSIPIVGADYTTSLGFTGQDVYVAIIDTGIEKLHPFFQNRVALEACFASVCPNKRTEMIGSGAAIPVHYHGTHVAGIAGGKNDTVQGVAPGIKFIAINVFDPFGGAFDGDIVKALNWVGSLSSQYNIASVNMSLGGSLIFKENCDTYLPSMTAAINNLKSKNIATIISSGNSYAVGMSAPACISSAVSVAATTGIDDKVATFSNVSQYTTLSAPGQAIYSSKLMGSYGSASGTSMAAPFVAGAFAVYRQKFGVQTIDKVVSDFQNSSSPALDEYSGIVTKRINLKKLFEQSVPPTTTTTSSTTTTLPPTTTTTTTVPETTTTTTTTTIPVTTTTTIALPTTTTTFPGTTTTTTIPNVTSEMLGKPRLFALLAYSTNYSSPSYDIFIAGYIDVTYGKNYVTHYLLTCNDGKIYTIPKNENGRLHFYRLKNDDGTFANAIQATSCILRAASNNVLGPQTWNLNVSK